MTVNISPAARTTFFHPPGDISANVRNNNNIREAVSGKNREIEGGQREGGRE